MGSNVARVAEEKPTAPAHTPQSRNNRKLPNIGDVFNPYGLFNGVWVPEPLLKSTDISASAKLLFGRLARFAGKDGRCFPSVGTLAVELGMTARQVQRLIARLCEAGFLRKDAQYRSDGSQTSNAFFFLYHASLVPAMPVIEPSKSTTPRQHCRQATAGGDKNVTPDRNATGGVTAVPPREETQKNSVIVDSSSSSTAPNDRTPSAAADLDPNRYPLSSARFREFFPRTTDSVIVRILRAILAACPDGTDDDIATAVCIQRDQNSPGLWVHTMPGSVRTVLQRRVPPAVHIPKCQFCGDAGWVWDGLDKSDWCPAACEAAEKRRLEFPTFVEEWKAHCAEKFARTTSDPQITGDPNRRRVREAA